jgi:hypothetical protein
MCQWEEIPRRTATRGWRTDLTFEEGSEVDGTGGEDGGGEGVVDEGGVTEGG